MSSEAGVDDTGTFEVLRLGTVNVNSLINKVDFVAGLLDDFSVSVLSVCETWLVDSCSSSFVDISGFVLLRGDVSGAVRKHGTAIYVRSTLKPILVNVDISNVAVVLLPGPAIYVVSVYRPPSYTDGENGVLLSFLLDFCRDKEVVVLGDFNLPSLRWDSSNPISGYVPPTDMSFFDAFSLLGLVQLVKEPTYDLSSNILDLVFVSVGESVLQSLTLPPLAGCHHSPILLDYCCRERFEQCDSQGSGRRLWFKANYREICDNLELIDWDCEFLGLELDGCGSRFYSILQVLINQFVPVTEDSAADMCCSFPPPRCLIREKSSLWAHFKQLRRDLGRNHTSTVQALSSFNQINFRIKNFSRLRRVEHERELAARLESDPKLFHSYIRRKKQGRAPVGPLRNSGDDLIAEPIGICEVLANTFSKAFVDTVPAVVSNHQTTVGTLDCPAVSYEQVCKLLHGLDGSSSPGPDGIHPYFLKSCGYYIAYPLTLIFSMALTRGKFPDVWKESVIVPLFKGGSRCNPLNYRPISLTSVCAKTFERILSSHILEYLDGYQVLSNMQYGFRPERSTEDQLLYTYGIVSDWVDSGASVNMVFLDYSKASSY